jgi:hypothetical protein
MRPALGNHFSRAVDTDNMSALTARNPTENAIAAANVQNVHLGLDHTLNGSLPDLKPLLEVRIGLVAVRKFGCGS